MLQGIVRGGYLFVGISYCFTSSGCLGSPLDSFIVTSLGDVANPQFRTDCREPDVELFSKELLRGVLEVDTDVTNCVVVLGAEGVGQVVGGVH